MYANPVNFVFIWVPVTRDKVVKVQEPLPNRLIKQSINIIQYYSMYVQQRPWNQFKASYSLPLKYAYLL